MEEIIEEFVKKLTKKRLQKTLPKISKKINFRKSKAIYNIISYIYYKDTHKHNFTPNHYQSPDWSYAASQLSQLDDTFLKFSDALVNNPTNEKILWLLESLPSEFERIITDIKKTKDDTIRSLTLQNNDKSKQIDQLQRILKLSKDDIREWDTFLDILSYLDTNLRRVSKKNDELIQENKKLKEKISLLETGN